MCSGVKKGSVGDFGNSFGDLKETLFWQYKVKNASQLYN